MKLLKYEIQIGNEWHPVRGYVNLKGWLEWKDKDGCQGLKQAGSFRAVGKHGEEPNGTPKGSGSV